LARRRMPVSLLKVLTEAKTAEHTVEKP